MLHLACCTPIHNIYLLRISGQTTTAVTTIPTVTTAVTTRPTPATSAALLLGGHNPSPTLALLHLRDQIGIGFDHGWQILHVYFHASALKLFVVPLLLQEFTPGLLLLQQRHSLIPLVFNQSTLVHRQTAQGIGWTCFLSTTTTTKTPTTTTTVSMLLPLALLPRVPPRPLLRRGSILSNIVRFYDDGWSCTEKGRWLIDHV